METKQTSSAEIREGEFLRVLPFYLQGIDPEGQLPLPVALWRHSTNCCEGGGETRCDDSQGLYYTIAGDEVTWWCPRHWYDYCLGPRAPYRLLDMTDEQYRREYDEHKQRLLKDWEIVSERIESSAYILSGPFGKYVEGWRTAVAG
jgi:hypothetical protein